MMKKLIALTCAQRNSVTATARQPVSTIISLRCDGVVEHCYEYNNVKIYGGSHWDISKWGYIYRNHHSGYGVTPRIQATQRMYLISNNP